MELLEYGLCYLTFLRLWISSFLFSGREGLKFTYKNQPRGIFLLRETRWSHRYFVYLYWLCLGRGWGWVEKKRDGYYIQKEALKLRDPEHPPFIFFPRDLSLRLLYRPHPSSFLSCGRKNIETVQPFPLYSACLSKYHAE